MATTQDRTERDSSTPLASDAFPCHNGSMLRDAWDVHAQDWFSWAREPGHDSYWRFHRDAFLPLIPAPGRLTLDIGCGEGRVGRDLEQRGHRDGPGCVADDDPRRGHPSRRPSSVRRRRRGGATPPPRCGRLCRGVHESAECRRCGSGGRRGGAGARLGRSPCHGNHPSGQHGGTLRSRFRRHLPL
jgi:hypothetical protein